MKAANVALLDSGAVSHTFATEGHPDEAKEGLCLSLTDRVTVKKHL